MYNEKIYVLHFFKCLQSVVEVFSMKNLIFGSMLLKYIMIFTEAFSNLIHLTFTESAIS